jgi:hypothetical protein
VGGRSVKRDTLRPGGRTVILADADDAMEER